MRAPLVLFLGLAAAATACGPATTTPPATPADKPRTVSASKAPAAVPSVGTPAPTRTVTLQGTVRLDAAWLTRAGIAEPLPGGGAKVRAGSLIANNGGAVVARDGASVIARDGASLISDRGAGLVSDRGGAVISTGGGALTSKTKYALAQAPGLAPVQGLMVAAVSLNTHEPLGLPVFTDAAGDWSLAVPESLRENVVIIAAVPGTTAEDPVLRDPRMQFAVVAQASAAATVIDEDTALVGKYLRRSFVDRLVAMADADDFAPYEELLRVGTFFPPATEDALVAMLKAYHDDARAAGHADLDEAGKLGMAQRATDALLARVALPGIQASAATTPGLPGAPFPALPALADGLRAVREATGAKLAADPVFFASAPFLAGQSFTIERPSDVGDFVVDAYLVKNSLTVWQDVVKVFDFIGVSMTPDGAMTERTRMRAASEGIVAAIADAWGADENGEQAAVKAAVTAK